MKKVIILLIVLAVLGGGAYFYMKSSPAPVVVPQEQAQTPPPSSNEPSGDRLDNDVVIVDKTKTVLGKSVEGRDIVAYHYGEGSSEGLFVGGIHGGYEWNTVLLANELMSYL